MCSEFWYKFSSTFKKIFLIFAEGCHTRKTKAFWSKHSSFSCSKVRPISIICALFIGQQMYYFMIMSILLKCRREWNRNFYVNGNSQTYHYYLRTSLSNNHFLGINFLWNNEGIVCFYKHSFPQRRFILVMFRDACRFRIHSPLAFTFITGRIFRNLCTLYLLSITLQQN